MSVLLTGCAGFIGWTVAERLLRSGYDVVGVDNLNTAYDVRLKHWRLEELRHHRNFRFEEIDITDLPRLQVLFAAGHHPPFEAVVNLAARAGVRQSVEDPWIYISANVTGTLNLLDLARRHGVTKFVQASTSSVYGNGPQPFQEDQPTDRPLSPYAASKKSAELLCHTYVALYGLDVTILRYFTVYGPAGRPDMSIFRFIRWIAEGEPLILYGDGTQRRDFTYVDDVAAGTVAALRTTGFAVINLGSDRPVSVGEVVSLLETMLRRKTSIERRDMHPADVSATWADISRARDLLKWSPSTTLNDGLASAVSWYLEHRAWASSIAIER